MEKLWQDIRYGVRMLAKRPGFTIVAVLTLALGIGANSAIFSVVNAVLLRPLPYQDPERIMTVYESRPSNGVFKNAVSLPNFFDWRTQSQNFESMSAFHDISLNRTDGSEPVRVSAMRASANIFELLGVKPLLGRGFLPTDEQRGNDNVAVLAYGYWQKQFGGDAKAIGKTMRLDGKIFTIIGVLPRDFQVPANDSTELWQPLAQTDDEKERGMHYLNVIGRLKPGVSRPQAQVEMDTISARLAQQYQDTNGGRGVSISPLHDELVGETRPALYTLLAAVGFVLLIACANVANLLLARASSRQKEIAVRLAVGASRFRLIRQFITESVMLSLFGGLLGLLLALWGVDILMTSAPDNIPRLTRMALDGRVLGFTALISLLTGVFFGLAPALQASNPDLIEALKDGSKSTTPGLRRQRLRSMFIITEVALAVVLLIGSGLLIHSFVQLTNVKPGFDPTNITAFDISLTGEKYKEPQMINFMSQFIERLRSIPGVESVGTVAPLPLSDSSYSFSFDIEGQSLPKAERSSANWRGINEDYLHTMRIPVIKGRNFTRDDNDKAEKVILINQTMAQRFFPNEDPVGHRIQIGYHNYLCRIIGIVGDVKHQGLDKDAGSEMYTNYLQTPWQETSIVLRSKSDPTTLIAAVRNELKSLDKELPIYSIKSLESVVANSVAQQRFNALLLGIFAAVALLLAAIGIYGVISYSVSQRTHEIAIRMALGAQQQNILRLIVGEGLKLILIGIAIGTIGSFAITRLMAGLLFNVSTSDPITYLVTIVVLLSIALLACFIPARRATRVDPMEALRCD